MNRRTFLKLSALTWGFYLTGCATNGNGITSSFLGNKKIPISRIPKKNEIVTSPEYYLDVRKLSVINKDGKYFFDPEGDIISVFYVKEKNKWYYVGLKPHTKYFFIKTLPEQKLVKTFNAVRVNVLNNVNNVLIAVQLANYGGNILFDNIYEFNGSKFKLINKNVNVGQSFETDGVFFITRRNAIDVRKNYYITQNTIRKLYDFTLLSFFIGGVDDKLVYILSEGVLGINNALAVYDSTNNKSYVLCTKEELNGGKMQFLRSGYKIVLKYTLNGEDKYIYLNELYEVNGVDNGFKPIIITNPHKYSATEKYKKFNFVELNYFALNTNKFLF